MISGIGTDIVEVARIQAMLDEYENHFLENIFTDREIKEAGRRKNKAQYFAGRWAGKEALAKALGCGFGEMCEWKDISILNAENGKPLIRLKGRALQTSKEMGIKSTHISISHEKHYACASVVVET